MAGRGATVEDQTVLPSISTSARRSTRKRNAIEIYTNDLNALDEYVKPQAQPSRKRRKIAPTGSASITKPSIDPAPKSGKGKAEDGKRYRVAVDGNAEEDISLTTKSKEKVVSEGDEEKRLKRFKAKMPKSFETTMERAITQRMFVIERKRHYDQDCPHSKTDCPMEVVDLAGTTGNCYQVVINHIPTCTCPNFVKGNPQCKHILYVLLKVLKVTGDLQYQAAYLTSELRHIFENAGPLPTDTVTSEDEDGKRKPIEGDCPICVETLDPAVEEIVWCHAACGNNLHKTCFDLWATSKRGAQVTCPYCRTPWQMAINEQAIKTISKTGAVNEDGYVNIAGELGISGRRDYSTYHPYWVRRQHRAGFIDREDAAPHYDYDYDYGHDYEDYAA